MRCKMKTLQKVTMIVISLHQISSFTTSYIIHGNAHSKSFISKRRTNYWVPNEYFMNRRSNTKQWRPIITTKYSKSKFFFDEYDDEGSYHNISDNENEGGSKPSYNKSYISKIEVTNLAGMVSSYNDLIDHFDHNSKESKDNGTIVMRLNPGLVAVTGETGSGKSLLLNKAVALACGCKAKASDIYPSQLVTRDGNEPTNDVNVNIEISLVPSQSKMMVSILKDFGLDSSMITETGKLKLSRTMRRPPGKVRLQSTCTINDQNVSLRILNQISSSILTIVDTPTASLAFAKEKSRISMIDQGVDSYILQAVQETARNYKEARSKREKIEKEIEERESVLPPSILQTKLNQDQNDNSSNYYDETLRLLQHWVDELDEFEQRLAQLQSQATDIVSLSKETIKVGASKSKTPSHRPEQGLSIPNIYEAAKNLAESTWSNSISADLYYTNLLEFQEGLKALDIQMERAYAAHDALISLSSESSVATAIETVRNHLYELTPNSSCSTDESSDVDSIIQATEHTHDLLNDLELSLIKCANSIDGQSNRGIINLLEELKQTITLTTEDIDLFISDWNSLSRKHNISPYNLPKCHLSLRCELEGDTAARDQLPKALEEEKITLLHFEDDCKQLTENRQKIAKKLSASVSSILPQLGMEGYHFVVHLNENVRECTSPSAYTGDTLGVDSVDFTLINQNGEHKDTNTIPSKIHAMNSSKNKGKLELVASSGEKARILLAIETQLPGSVGAACGNNKKVLESAMTSANNQNFNLISVVYDEIDAHVGGRAAVAVARLLSEQSQVGGQVVSITHSASVAAIADQHIVVQKFVNLDSNGNNKVYVRAASLDGTERKKELARMASGDLAATEAELFAEALLRDGELQKGIKTKTIP